MNVKLRYLVLLIRYLPWSQAEEKVAKKKKSFAAERVDARAELAAGEDLQVCKLRILSESKPVQLTRQRACSIRENA